MRRRLLAATAAVLLALGVAAMAVEQTTSSGRGIRSDVRTTHSQPIEH